MRKIALSIAYTGTYANIRPVFGVVRGTQRPIQPTATVQRAKRAYQRASQGITSAMILDANLATNRHQGVGMAVKPATHQKGGQARSAKYSPKRQKAEQMNKSGMNKSEKPESYVYQGVQ